ncbi:MAG TPA: hypothetical protein VF463_15580 [Sphingobium sp.]
MTTFEMLMAGENAQMVFTDVPDNIPINGHICGLGKMSTMNSSWGRER